MSTLLVSFSNPATCRGRFSCIEHRPPTLVIIVVERCAVASCHKSSANALRNRQFHQTIPTNLINIEPPKSRQPVTPLARKSIDPAHATSHPTPAYPAPGSLPPDLRGLPTAPSTPNVQGAPKSQLLHPTMMIRKKKTRPLAVAEITHYLPSMTIKRPEIHRC